MSRKIFFNEGLHKYTDEYNNVFTSVTTVIGKYKEKFDTEKMARICAQIGRNPRHPKYLKYRGKTEKRLKAEWKRTTEIALDRGNDRHNYLEGIIKSCNNYNKVRDKFTKDRIFTIPDIVSNPVVGRVSLEKLKSLSLDKRYPLIYNTIKALVKEGWKIYAEIGTYSADLLISGLVDLLLVKDDKFIIIDWKTNKAPISFKSGYYEKDAQNNITNNFILDHKTFEYPLQHIPASSGHTYTLQLSSYAYLIELFGLKLNHILLFHIRPSDINNQDSDEIIDVVGIKYLKTDVGNMLNHHASSIDIKTQKGLFV